MKRPTVLFVGGEDVRYRIPLARILNTQYGFDVIFAGSEVGDIINDAGFKYLYYPLQRSFSFIKDLKAVLVLSVLLKKYKIDIVQTFDTKPSIIVPIAVKLSCNTVVIRTITGMGSIFSGKNIVTLPLKILYMFFQYFTSKLTDVTVFQNEDDKNFFLKYRMVKQAKSAIIPGSGINATEINSKIKDFKVTTNEECLKVVMISRLTIYKGVIEYLNTAKILKKETDCIKFMLVGPCENNGKKTIVEQLLINYSEYVDYIGPSNKVIEILANNDIFVLPSYYREGIPRVLLEAGAAGLPLITTNTPGCKEVVKNGWNGILIPPKDTMALVNAIKKMLALPINERKMMGQRSIDHVKTHFDLTLITKSYANLYSNIN